MDESLPRSYYSVSVHPTRLNLVWRSMLPRRSPDESGTFEEKEEMLNENGKSHEMPKRKPEQFVNNQHRDELSPTARRKVVRAIEYLIYLAQPKALPKTVHGKGLKFRLSFVTLTLSARQHNSDVELTGKLLNQFFVEAKKKWGVDRYIWRAEKQANGNVHFHVICDKFIPWNELRNTWNRLQNKKGFEYVDLYRKEQQAFHKGKFRFRPELASKWNYRAQLKAYREGVRIEWSNPNSTDIHSIRHVSNVLNYFIKYMTKQEQSMGIHCRLWACSESLSKLRGGEDVLAGSLCDEMKKVQADTSVHQFHSDYFSVFYITPAQLQSMGCNDLCGLFNAYINERFPGARPPGLWGAES